MRMSHPNRIDLGLLVGLFHSSTNIPINYHPMNLLPALATTSNPADFFTRPLPINSHHRYTQFIIGDDPIAPTPTTSVATATVDSSATVVASTAASVSDSVPSLHPNPAPLPIVLDTGASFSLTPFASDFLPVAQAPYGLIRSPISVVSKYSKALASTPVDPYTLITGEVVSVDPIDLSSPDITTIAIDSDSGPSFSGPSFIKVHFDVRQFGTASLTFIFSPNWSLIKVFVTPTQVDWIHWVPIPRLILPESYFHIFGLDYLQAFALFHLIPIWIALVSALLRSE